MSSSGNCIVKLYSLSLEIEMDLIKIYCASVVIILAHLDQVRLKTAENFNDCSCVTRQFLG